MEEVESVHSLISRNKKTMASHGSNAYLAPIFFIAMGLIFVGHGVWTDGIFGFASLMGMAFIAYGGIVGVRVARWKASLTEP